MLPPYAETLGVTIVLDDATEAPLLAMAVSEALLGRPGFLHGGALAGLLELAGVAAARHAIGDGAVRIKPIGLTIDFLRGGREVETCAQGRIVRLGARIAAVETSAWQGDPNRPIAAARMNLSLDRG